MDISATLDTFTREVPFEVRLATPDDVNHLEWGGQFIQYRRVFRRALTDQQQGHRWLLVVVCNDYPVGRLFVLLNSAEHDIADGRTRAYLYSFRVLEGFQGMGLGTRLVQVAERLLVARQFSHATIAVAKDNADALRLYQRLGYRTMRDSDGRWSYTDHEGLLHHVYEPCWILEKGLVAG